MSAETTDDIMNTAAVSRVSGSDAGKILGKYVGTDPKMAQNHTMEAAQQQQPKGAGGAVDPTRG